MTKEIRPMFYVDPKSVIAPKPTLGANEYQCDCCRRVLTKGCSVEEAMQEAAELFPGLEPENAAIVCDDCYKILMAHAELRGIKWNPDEQDHWRQ